MPTVTKEIEFPDLVIRVYPSPKGERLLDVTSRMGGIKICEAQPLQESSDFDAELLEILRPFGVEGEAPASSRAKLQRGFDSLLVENERLRGLLDVGGDDEADFVPPHELPAIAQRISDGANVPPGELEGFVLGVFDAAALLGDEVGGRVARVLDFVARELAPVVKDASPPTPPDPPPVRAPVIPTTSAAAPAAPPPQGRRPVVPAIPQPVRLSPTAKANLEFLERKKLEQKALTPDATEPTSELRAVADKVLRGETLDLGELQRFVEACRFVTLDEQMSNAFTEAQDHLKSLEG
jgi:hypothetical protein